jgi:serine/threonine protein kinase
MEPKKKISGYTIFMNRMLGEGAFGKVYVGEQDGTKLHVAIKALAKQTGTHRNYRSESGPLHQIGAVLRNLNPEKPKVAQRCWFPGCDGERQLLLHHSGVLHGR